MYLFFDGVSSLGYIGLYDSERNLVSEDTFQISGNESTQTIPVIDTFLEAQGVSYADIQNIVTVAGPGSFTGIRTISLVVNTLAYIYPNITLTSVNFFDLYEKYPIVKSSSKRDLFVKSEKSATIEVLQNGDFENQCKADTFYGDTNLSRFEKKFVLDSIISYPEIFKNIIFEEKKQISPLYIKKPNIS